jgi:hypothetical protein
MNSYTDQVTGGSPGSPAMIQPYLFFRGRCEEAINYYKETLGAEVRMLMRFKDNPEKPSPDKVSAAFDEGSCMQPCVSSARRS